MPYLLGSGMAARGVALRPSESQERGPCRPLLTTAIRGSGMRVEDQPSKARLLVLIQPRRPGDTGRLLSLRRRLAPELGGLLPQRCSVRVAGSGRPVVAV